MDTPEALAKAIVQAASTQSSTIEWQHALERGILTALRAAEAAAYERAARVIERLPASNDPQDCAAAIRALK